MKDFLNFDIERREENGHSVFTLRHRTRENISVQFITESFVNAVYLPKLIIDLIRAYAKKYRLQSREAMTAAQKNFYDKLVEFHRNQGRPPTYDEQCVFLGVVSKGTPHYYVKKLVEAGWIWIDDNGMVIPCDIASPEMDDA